MMKTIGATLIALLCTAPALAARNYLTVERSVEVARAPDVVWQRLGNFCELGELIDAQCAIESGDGGVGTVRRLNGVTVETLVARTPHSYTYSQVEGARANTDYHGTMAVEPLGEGRSRLVYTLVIDGARLPPGTDLAVYRRQLEERFQGAVVRAKTLLEAAR